jgi:hypothetical protein
MTASLPPALLRRIGEALYGEPWQSRLAADLDVADRTLRRWVSGEMAVPSGVVEELRVLVRGRLVEFRLIAQKLDAATGPVDGEMR